MTTVHTAVLDLIQHFTKPELTYQDSVGCALAVTAEHNHVPGHFDDKQVLDSYYKAVTLFLSVAPREMIRAGFPTIGHVRYAIQEGKSIADVIRVAVRLSIRWSERAFETRDNPTPREKLLRSAAYAYLTPRFAPHESESAFRQAAAILSAKIKSETSRPGIVTIGDLFTAVNEKLESGKSVGWLSISKNGKWRLEPRAIASALRNRSQFASAGQLSGDSQDSEQELQSIFSQEAGADVMDCVRIVREAVNEKHAVEDGHSVAALEAATEVLIGNMTQEEAARKYLITRKQVRNATKWIKKSLGQSQAG